MDEADEILIPTETQSLHNLRHWGLTIFVTLSLIILGASLVAALITR